MTSINTVNQNSVNKLILNQINKISAEPITLNSMDIKFKPILKENHFLMASNNDNCNGLLIEKIDINLFFPDGLDISSFKTKRIIQCPKLIGETVIQVEQSLGDGWIGPYFNLMDKPGNHPTDLLQRFIVICKTLGVTILYPEDVTLQLIDKTLYISPIVNNPFYKGIAKVITW